jgi:hypothetical protein
MSCSGSDIMRYWSVALAVLLLLGGGQVEASINGDLGTPGDDPPLPVNGGWQYFSWFDAPPAWDFEGAFTFTIGPGDTGELKVTDIYVDGDQFQVYDWETLIGTTSVPTNNHDYETDVDAAYASPKWSSGLFLLGAGAHSIQLYTIAIATEYTAGVGYLRVDSVIPEPCSLAVWSLLAAVGVAVGLRRRRRAA